MNRWTRILTVVLAAAALGACSDNDTIDSDAGTGDVDVTDTGDTDMTDTADAGDTDMTDTVTDTADDTATDTADDTASDTADDTATDADDDTAHDADDDAGHEVHWGYSGEEGPDHWGDLDEAWATCGSGSEQSPIDLDSTIPACAHPELELDYGDSALTILNNGHTVQVNVAADSSTLTVDGHEYALLQFHFHAASEHTVDGAHSPIEMHLVHKDDAGNLAVVGVLLEEGSAENTAFADIWSHLPTEEAEAETIDGVTINPGNLLPGEQAYWHYSGSLTTPPCTEGVSWYVMPEPVELSAAQIDAFEAIFDHNYRPTQPLNDRHVEAPHWTYEGDAGPTHWGDLSPAYATCGSGTEQSPIDIDSHVPSSLHPELTTTYGASVLTMLNNGHTVQANLDAGSSVLTVDGHSYNALQFHFHASSEHTVDGASYPIEMHIVHKDDAGNLAVVGVFLEGTAGSDNADFAPIFTNMPTEEAPATPVAGTNVNPGDLLPDSLDYWHYDGSLTTPPCSEGVSWYVLKTPVAISAAQVAAFEAVYDANNRPTQGLNDRHLEGPHWSYDGDTAASHWADLSPAYDTCGTGTEQSPIDIPSGTTPNDPSPTFSYADSALKILNNGHTIQCNVDAGSSLTVGGDTWNLVQFHFHAHSEHTIDGVSAPIEMHLVHKNDAGDLAVVGVFFIEDADVADNTDVAEIWSHLPTTESEEETIDGVTINAGDFIPGSHEMWRYDGSLTTPPCSEGVRWHVMANAITISDEQANAFEAIFDHNYRPTQALNSRTIE